jgi:Flp pilus assembly protein TadG
MLIKASEKGQSLILIAFAAVALFAFAALAIDGSAIFSDRRHAQNAADTAALDAALTKTRGGDWEAEGLQRALSNGYNNNGATNDVLLYNPPIDGPYQGNNQYVQVKIRSDVKTTFARVIGFDMATNRVQAVARATPSEYNEMFYGNAVVGLSPTDCKAVTYQGNANTNVSGGGIFVMSNCPSAAFFNHSGAAQLTAPSLCAVGGIDYAPGALNVGSIHSGCNPPPPIVEPNPQCSGPAIKSGNALSPGSWTGQFPPAGVDTLESGIYCVDGDFRLNGGESLTGSGVVIRMDDGVVSWNGGATLHLSAPSGGPYQGLLLYMPSSPANCSTITLNGNSDSTIEGTILAPCAEIKVDGTGDSGINGQVIGYKVDLSGNSANRIHYENEKNYNALTQPGVELSQ